MQQILIQIHCHFIKLDVFIIENNKKYIYYKFRIYLFIKIDSH